MSLGVAAGLLGCLALGLSLQAENKVIHLRNERLITAAVAPGTTVAAAAAGPVSGLYLVQFKDRIESSWVERVRGMGIEPLRYVPDDAFVARLRQARLEQLRALPFVHWVGEYRPEFKVHPSLRAVRPGGAGTVQELSLLLAPGASAVEVLQARRAMALVRRVSRSRLGTIVQGTPKTGQLEGLAASAAVLWMEPAPRMKLFDEVASRLVGGDPGEPSLHQTIVQQLGFTGQGVAVAVADSGLNNGDADSMHPDLAGRTTTFLYYGNLEDAADEHSHGTHVAGIVAGNGATGEVDENGYLYGLGVAPGAEIVTQRIFDGVGHYEPPASHETLTHDAVRHGAVIGSNSWGDDTQGRYDLSAAEFDALVRDADAQTPGEQPYVLEFSAGNAGPGAQTVGSPAVAKNVIATGASESDRVDFFIYADGPDAIADFSSRGPCEDGRIKPDVVAPGTWIASLQSASATDEYAWMPISGFYQYQGGTSQAGPHASGAAAVFVQYYRETHGGATPSPALVKATLINSADDLDDAAGYTGPLPNWDEGWGRINLANLIASSRRFDFVDQTVLLTNRQVFERRMLVGNPNEPLKITLTYSDVPGFPAAIPALVNDLDLEVTSPDGTVYRGNQFADGESVVNPEAGDRVNNVEGVHLASPPPGEYVVRVRAQNVVEDVHQAAHTPARQDFALVISGDLPLPGVGVLLMDRPAYTAPGVIQLRLIDYDLARQASVDVQVSSGTEPQGERIRLLPFGSAGVFTGAVATVTGAVVADGRLQVRHGDHLDAAYSDASPAGTRTASAVADLAAPVISAITATSRFARTVIQWDTDEPAQAIVRYGPSRSLTLAATNALFETQHGVGLSGLTPGATYYFMVVSMDAAGNASTNNNNGQLYSVVPAAAPTVLLVDAFVDPFGLFDIPVTTYTDALDQAGIGYEAWDVASEGRTPRLDELRAYPVVMWRVPELSASLTATDVRALSDYVTGGGGLFMASMELLSRLDESGFTGFRQNVLHVESYDVDPGVPGITGVENLSLTSGIDTELDYSAYPDLIIISPDLSDTFRPTTNAAPVLFDWVFGQPVGVRFPRTGEDSSGRVVFFSFPLDTVPFDGPAPNNRVELVRNLVAFLAPGIGGSGMLELDREDYSIPARMTIELADSDLAGRGQTTVRVVTDLSPQGQSLVLDETPRAGLFRGFLTLVSQNSAVSAGQARVRDGDLVVVEYQEQSPARTLRAAAVVDVSLPEVLPVTVEPDYAEAVIRFGTSEPTDALVQFGESTFLGRTAYADTLTTDHELRLSGLQPDRDYFFQVVCRDAAGNTTVDDHQGRYYSFHTLRPLTPPFTDDLERGDSQWLVVNDSLDEETSGILASSVWQLGQPSNELAGQARSGANAWGTNLRGEGNDYANTSLIGPAIHLTGGNQATLRFWHNYDFMPRSEEGDILETGGVYVTADNGATWVTLAEFGELSEGWEPVELDLSPYVGQVIRLGWAYALFSMDSVVHPGWLVDDIAVTIANVERGTIVITNNLAEARFQLTGPLDLEGGGWSWQVTNAPPGQYVARFSPAPYYVTPAPQTNTLRGTNTIVFQGAYTFVDVNRNGMSDAWELAFFGQVAPVHPGDWDTDRDGFSDYAEFMAGTNPTNALSWLALSAPALLPNRTVRLDWPSVPGRAYRVLMSFDLVEWLPASAWNLATSANSSLVLPPLTGSAGYFFQLEVRP